jgi:hypothetical protein
MPKETAMDTDQFDSLATHLHDHLPRRRSLGLLGVLGMAGIASTQNAIAGGKRRKKRKKGKNGGTTTPAPQCSRCTDCEACVNGSCQPLADGAICKNSAVCAKGVCGRRCASNGECPAGSSCEERIGTMPDVCVANVADACAQTFCFNGEAVCPAGEVCVLAPCGGGEPHCMAVIAA